MTKLLQRFRGGAIPIQSIGIIGLSRIQIDCVASVNPSYFETETLPKIVNGAVKRPRATTDRETSPYGLSTVNPLNAIGGTSFGRARVSLNRREMLRLGAMGAAGAIISTA